MTQSRGLKKTLVLSALCVLGLAVVGPAADPMTMVPSGSLFCVRINNLDGALGQIDMFLTGLLPFGVSMPVKAQLAQFLGGPQPQGVNMAGGFVLFGPLPGGDPDPSRIGLLVPVSSYQQFVSGNPNVGQPNAQGISQIGPEGAPMLAAVEVGGYALVSTIGNEEALTTLKASGAGSSTLASALDAAELKQSGSAPVWIYANVELAGQLFGPMLHAKIEEAKQTMQAMEAQGQGAMAKQATANIEASAAMLDTLMKETKYLSISLTPSVDKIVASFVLASVPGSGMAQMFQGGSSSANKLLGYMQDGAAVNFAGSMNSPLWQKLNEAYIDLMPKMMGEGASADDVASLKKMITDAMGAFGGAMAGSMSVDTNSKPPFRVTYVADLKDPAKFSQLMDQAAQLLTTGSVGKFYEQMGMQCTFALKKNASTHAGVPIDTVTFGLKGTRPDAPETQMINALYGDGFDIQMATVNNQLVYALGPDAQSAVQKLIDQAKAGGPKQVAGEAKAALAMIPGADKADFFMSLNVLRVMKIASAFAPMPLPQTDIPSQSSIAVAGNAGGGKMTVDLAVPKQHVQEIMAVAMQMQQQQMQP
ncbi:MAG TPA: hypothetical protein PLU87_13720 [Sedimentisphaerales bacterium]|nr:hypothetical protein [Sedimentisphaerales bacterium]HRS12110.1 hypothetical protein [Sedimentisphaerales bacterium]HRV48708.1 hypothetical protein [Sedimentisphaerales bacterium]